MPITLWCSIEFDKSLEHFDSYSKTKNNLYVGRSYSDNLPTFQTITLYQSSHMRVFYESELVSRPISTYRLTCLEYLSRQKYSDTYQSWRKFAIQMNFDSMSNHKWYNSYQRWLLSGNSTSVLSWSYWVSKKELVIDLYSEATLNALAQLPLLVFRAIWDSYLCY